MGIVQLPFPPGKIHRKGYWAGPTEKQDFRRKSGLQTVYAPPSPIWHTFGEKCRSHKALTDLSFRCKDGPGMLYLGQGPVVCEGICRQASSGRRFATCHGRSSMRYL